MTISPATNIPSQSIATRWQMLGGDRFYVAARWAVLLLVALIGTLLVQAPIWPPSLAMPPLLLLIWCYAIFNLLATFALLLPFLSAFLNFAFLVDIVFISLFTYFSHDPRDLFYPLYLLPLV